MNWSASLYAAYSNYQNFPCLRQVCVIVVFVNLILLLNVGYKLWQHISKGLQRCSEAIRNAITHYNVQAMLINRPTITWKEIMEYTFLGEFDLLWHSRLNIWDWDWAKPTHWEATLKYFKLCHTKEEISTHLHVEVCWLYTSIHDELIFMAKAIDGLQQSNPVLTQELQCQYHSCTAINTVHIKHLDHIEMHADFTGIQGSWIQCEAAQDGDNHSSPTVDLINNVNPSLAEDSHGNNEAINHEEDTLFTQMLADYIEEIYNWYLLYLYTNL